MTPSEIVLGRLIEERLTPGADVAEIDRRLRAHFETESCIVFAGMAALPMRTDEQGIIPFLSLIHEFRRIARPVFATHEGHVVKTLTRSLLVSFRRAPNALAAVLSLRKAVESWEAAAAGQRMDLRVGVGFGRVLSVGDHDVYGVEVNDAMRLGEELARPGEILLTDAARAVLLHSPGIDFDPLPSPRSGGGAVWRARPHE